MNLLDPTPNPIKKREPLVFDSAPEPLPALEFEEDEDRTLEDIMDSIQMEKEEADEIEGEVGVDLDRLFNNTAEPEPFEVEVPNAPDAPVGSPEHNQWLRECNRLIFTVIPDGMTVESTKIVTRTFAVFGAQKFSNECHKSTIS